MDEFELILAALAIFFLPFSAENKECLLTASATLCVINPYRFCSGHNDAACGRFFGFARSGGVILPHHRGAYYLGDGRRHIAAALS